MKHLRLYFSAVLLSIFSQSAAHAQTLDTALIKDLKNFFFDRTGYTPERNVFTEWNREPDYILFISYPDRLERPTDLSRDIVIINYKDSNAIQRALEKCDSLGFHTMLYDVPADALGKLRPEFPHYSNEGLAFLIFHELMHNFIRGNHYGMPYLFEEAICDVMGEFATIEFGKQDARINPVKALMQVKVNDSVYSAANRAIRLIADFPERTPEIGRECDSLIKGYLEQANNFQSFRFGYNANNAFLLKTRNYSWNYFICKQFFFEMPSVAAFSQAVCEISDENKERPARAQKFSNALFENMAWNVTVHTPPDSALPFMGQHQNLKLVVTQENPLIEFQKLLEHNCSPDEIDQRVCQIYWNVAIELLRIKSNSIINGDTIRGTEHFGQAWIASSAFIMDGHVTCWMQPINLFMGDTVILDFTKENTVWIEPEASKK
jgi:hypothetical protein